LPIDGYTEVLGEATPATPNTLAFGTNAVLKIVLSGASALLQTPSTALTASTSNPVRPPFAAW
jgi:hypothetical protein